MLRALKFEGSIPLTSLTLLPVSASSSSPPSPSEVEPLRLLAYEYGFYSVSGDPSSVPPSP
jgi:hypothetical protein